MVRVFVRLVRRLVLLFNKICSEQYNFSSYGQNKPDTEPKDIKV